MQPKRSILMDEQSRTKRFASRLAIAAAIGCVGTCDLGATMGYADQPTRNLRSLLAGGWAENAKPIQKPSAEPPAEKNPDLQVKVEPSKGVPKKSEAEAKTNRPKLTVPTETPRLAARPKRATLKSDSPTNSNPTATPSSLAELIKRRSRVLVVDQESQPAETANTDSIHIEQRPSVGRLDVEKRAEAIRARLKAIAKSNIRPAEPIADRPAEKVAKSQPTSTQRPVREETPLSALAEKQLAEKQSSSSSDEVVGTRQAKPAVPISQLAKQPASKPAKKLPAKESPANAAKSVARQTPVSSPEPDQQLESPVRFGSDGPAAAELARIATERARDLRTLTEVDIAPEIASEPISNDSRRIAGNGGFDLLPLKSFEPDQASELSSDAQFQTVTIHATRLRELAHQSLRSASDRYQRRAIHSAKKYTLEGLRLIVSMRDAQTGGNQHTRQLETAFDALRESEDFGGRFGALDQNAIRRMVDAHETDILKDKDIEHLSALEATESYLDVARQNLILACGGVSEACDALVLLGKIEKAMANPGDTHGAAVAVILQRAAVVIEPNSAHGYHELGTTLLQQGLVQQAAWALSRSVELKPTRAGYERLLEASRRLGDADTARVCLTSLKRPDLQSTIRVKTLSPQAFAATHRPQLAQVAPKTVETKQVQPKPAKTSATKVSFRSLFPFGRR